MELNTVQLITIIADKFLKEELVDLLKNEGVDVYTIFNAKEEKKVCESVKNESDNVQIKVLAEESVALALMQKIAERFFPYEKPLVYVQDVKVLRLRHSEKIAYKTIEGNPDPT